MPPQGLTETNTQLEKDIGELREAAQTRDGELSKKAEALATIQKRLKQKEDEVQGHKEKETKAQAALRRMETERDDALAAQDKALSQTSARNKNYASLSQVSSCARQSMVGYSS